MIDLFCWFINRTKLWKLYVLVRFLHEDYLGGRESGICLKQRKKTEEAILEATEVIKCNGVFVSFFSFLSFLEFFRFVSIIIMTKLCIS